MIVLLLLVLFAGDDAKGAQRWFEIAGIRFQPSEIAKIILILFFAYFFSRFEDSINTVRTLGIICNFCRYTFISYLKTAGQLNNNSYCINFRYPLVY